MAKEDLLTVLIVSIPVSILFLSCSGNALEYYGGGRCFCDSRFYKPVCASDGKTYFNPCFLRCSSMQYPRIVGLCYGECPCWKPAYVGDSLNYQTGNQLQHPNSNTYDSESTAGKEYDGRSKNSEVEVEAEGSCPCPKILKPVCGSNNQTYANQCLLDCEKENGYPCLTTACEQECPCPCTCNNYNSTPSSSY